MDCRPEVKLIGFAYGFHYQKKGRSVGISFFCRRDSYFSSKKESNEKFPPASQNIILELKKKHTPSLKKVWVGQETRQNAIIFLI